MSKLDFIFEMITYLISNSFPLHHDLLVAAILWLWKSCYQWLSYGKEKISRIFFKNEPVQANSDYKGYNKTWASLSSEK